MEQLDQPQEHQGEKYLALLDLGDMADAPITLQDGRVIPARDFLDVCGDFALPSLQMLESLSADDPDRSTIQDALRRSVLGYLNVSPEE